MVSDSKLIKELNGITEKLGGTIQRLTTFDSTGRKSKKIVIEYDIKEKKS
tara:strand:+ start:239 stop:388 length:150 start_codon:yes stop_codon:yes gene_type:complete